MKIKRFNENNQSIIDYIKECFIDLVESSMDDDITLDDSFYYDDDGEFTISICLPSVGNNFATKDNNMLLSNIITFNNMVNDRYRDIIHCINKVTLSYPNIEYSYEIMSIENESISKFVHIPYIEYVEIIFNV